MGDFTIEFFSMIADLSSLDLKKFRVPPEAASQFEEGPRVYFRDKPGFNQAVKGWLPAAS
jgi:hypothetical protein